MYGKRLFWTPQFSKQKNGVKKVFWRKKFVCSPNFSAYGESYNRLDTRALCEIVRDLNETQKSCSTNETLGVYFKDDSELQEYWTDQFSNNANYSEFKPVNISALFDREAETRINPSEEFWT